MLTMLEQIQQLAIAVLISATIVNAYGQGVNETQQKPTEEKQGGEYSGFEESQKQTQGIPNQQANPTPQAPISGVDIQQENQTTPVGSVAFQPASPSGIAMLGGLGAVVAIVIVAAVWYIRRNKR